MLLSMEDTIAIKNTSIEIRKTEHKLLSFQPCSFANVVYSTKDQAVFSIGRMSN